MNLNFNEVSSCETSVKGDLRDIVNTCCLANTENLVFLDSLKDKKNLSFFLHQHV